MECVIGGVVVVGVLVIISIIRGDADTSSHQRRSPRHSSSAGRFSVTSRSDRFDAGDGTTLPVRKITASGSMSVPRDNCRACIVVQVLDISPGLDEPHPVFCLMPELADHEGVFQFKQALTIPYQSSAVASMPILNLPLFALVCPHSGERKLQVDVYLTGPDGHTRVYEHAKCYTSYTQEVMGYIERRDRIEGNEHRLASLALAVSAADGHVDRSETTVIREFFTERYANQQDADKRKADISATLKKTLEKLRAKDATPRQLIKEACSELVSERDPITGQIAYEICVKVVAADGVVEDSEASVLSTIRELLGVDEAYVREVHDRNFRLSMYKDTTQEQLIEMPPGLSDDEKRDFLKKEYRKWRGRRTHADPEVATEAALRLDQIAKMRGQLGDD